MLQLPVVVVVLALSVSVPEMVCPSETPTRATITRAAQRYFAAGLHAETKDFVFMGGNSPANLEACVFEMESVLDLQKR
jgi:hypothetical protein